MSLIQSKDSFVGSAIAATDCLITEPNAIAKKSSLLNTNVQVIDSEGDSPVDDALRTFLSMHKDYSNDGAVTNSRGAPLLADPSLNVVSIDATTRMALLTAQSSEIQKESTITSLNVALEKISKNTEFRLSNLKDISNKAEDQAKHKHASKIFGWIGKVFATVAAVVAVAVFSVATVATGGAAAPLLAIAVIGLVAAGVSLADQISQEVGGPPISLSKMASGFISKVLVACGVDKDKAENIAQVVSMGLFLPALLILEPSSLGSATQALCELVGVNPDDAAKIGAVIGAISAVVVGIVMSVVATVATAGLAGPAATAQFLNSVMQAVAGLIEAGSDIGQGASNIATAKIQKEVSYLQASNVDLSAISDALNNQMKNDQDTLKTLLACIYDSMNSATQIMRSFFDTQDQISRNIGQGRSV